MRALASLLEVTRPYAKKLLEQGYEAQKLLKNFGQDVKNAGGYLRMIPKLSHDIFKGLAKGLPRLELEHSGLDPAFKKFENGLNRLTLGLVISASLIAAALILNSSKTLLTFEFRFFGFHRLAITEVLGMAGYIIATLLGLWLVFSIIRSRKL